MSLYGEYDGDGGDMYDSSGFPEPAPEPAPAAGSANPPSSPESQAFSQSLQVIASPASLLSEVLPPDPSQSKLPMGLAIVGACIVGIILANSIDKGR